MRAEDIGQIAEWLIWAELVARSEGRLHIFLPTRDMGVDGIARHPASDVSIPVQVKARTKLEGSVLRIHVQEDELRDPHAHVVAGLVDLASLTLSEPLLVMSADELRERAPLVPYGPRRAYSIEVPWPPGPRTRWHDLCVSRAEAAARLVPALAMDSEATSTEEKQPHAEPEPDPKLSAQRGVTPPPDQEALAVTGYIGEMELLRCAAGSGKLNVFHAFPDNEFVEYLVRHTDTGGVLGIQVKCIAVSSSHRSGGVKVSAATFHPSPRNHLVVFARSADGGTVEDCLLIPSQELAGLAPAAGGYMHLEWSPLMPGPYSRFALHPAVLGARLGQLAAAPS